MNCDKKIRMPLKILPVTLLLKKCYMNAMAFANTPPRHCKWPLGRHFPHGRTG